MSTLQNRHFENVLLRCVHCKGKMRIANAKISNFTGVSFSYKMAEKLF